MQDEKIIHKQSKHTIMATKLNKMLTDSKRVNQNALNSLSFTTFHNLFSYAPITQRAVFGKVFEKGTFGKVTPDTPIPDIEVIEYIEIKGTIFIIRVKKRPHPLTPYIKTRKGSDLKESLLKVM